MADKKTDAPARPVPEPVLAPAGESTDPRVHQLLAHREIAVLNGDAAAVEAVNGQLAELGVK